MSMSTPQVFEQSLFLFTIKINFIYPAPVPRSVCKGVGSSVCRFSLCGSTTTTTTTSSSSSYGTSHAGRDERHPPLQLAPPPLPLRLPLHLPPQPPEYDGVAGQDERQREEEGSERGVDVVPEVVDDAAEGEVQPLDEKGRETDCQAESPDGGQDGGGRAAAKAHVLDGPGHGL